MQVAGVGAQSGCLRGHGLHHARIAMADDRHIVVGIQIAAAIGIFQPHILTVHRQQRLIVKQAVGRPQYSAAGEQFGGFSHSFILPHGHCSPANP